MKANGQLKGAVQLPLFVIGADGKPSLTGNEKEIEAEKRASINNRIGKSFQNAQANSEASGGSAKTGNATAGNNPDADGLGIAGRSLRSRPKNRAK